MAKSGRFSSIRSVTQSRATQPTDYYFDLGEMSTELSTYSRDFNDRPRLANQHAH